MTIPARAFCEIYPRDVQLGSLFRLRDEWAMLVGYEDVGERDFLLLTGDRTGHLQRLTTGMPKCLALAPPFSWFAAISSAADVRRSERQTAALTISPRGPIVIGAMPDRFGDHEYIAFGLDGVVDREYELDGAKLRLLSWTAELAHASRPFESLGTLLTVNLPEPRD